MDVVIRDATAEDAGVITDLITEMAEYHAEALPQVLRVPPEKTATLQVVAGQLADPLMRLFLAERAGEVVGVVHVTVREVPPSDMLVPRRYLMVESLGVHSTERGAGIGRALMEKAEEWAREQGLSEVQLNVWEFNEPALRLYEKLGYATLSRKMGKSIE